MGFQINNIKDEILYIENLIPETFQDSVIDRVQGDQHFPWFLLHRIGHPDHYGKGTTPNYVDPNITDDVGFFHMAFDGNVVSPYYDFFRSILEFFTEKTNIKVANMLRVRLRYTHKGYNHSAEKYASPHVDFYTGSPYYTLVYYVNDSDGDTIIFDKIFNPSEEAYNPIMSDPLPELVRVNPKKGCGLFFNGHRFHAGNFPINYSSRIVINFDFEIM
jgi:hypothetical protein|tara:strand:+ start:2524 stop:3174 length:651 start_codon:yes stop_codon:yes gene_type:complete